nr:uncharacterized protein LOC105878047 [Microcebus murinus]
MPHYMLAAPLSRAGAPSLPVAAGGRAALGPRASGSPVSPRVWGQRLRRRRSPSPFAVAAAAGHCPAESPRPGGCRCPVRGSRWRGGGPRARFPRPVGAAQKGAGGRRLLPGGRRGAATVTAATGARAEARAPGGRGCRAQQRPGAPAPSGAPGQEPTQRPLRLRARRSRVRLSADPARGGRGRAHARPPARPETCTCTHRAPLRPRQPGRLLRRLPPPGPGACQPSLSASWDFPDGAMLFFQDNQGSSLPAIFLGGHLQRLFRGDFLSAGTTLTTTWKMEYCPFCDSESIVMTVTLRMLQHLVRENGERT